MPLQIRRGTEAERQTLTSTNGLVTGELLYVTNTQKLYIGTGVTGDHKGVAITGYTNEDAQDAVGPMFQNGTHNGIQFVYDDLNSYVNATVNLSNYQGVVKADGFVGSLFADTSTTLVDAVSGTFNLDGTVGTHVVPSSTSVYDLGTNTNKFRNLYLDGSSIHLGSAIITSSGSAINLPAGSTINGSIIGSATGDIKGSVFGDDSSLLVDAVDGRIYGDIFTDRIVSKTTTTVSVESKLLIDQYNSADAYGTDMLTLRRARGSLLASEVVQSGDVAGSIVSNAKVTSGYSTITGIVSRVQGIPTSTYAPGSLEFRVTGDSGDLLTPMAINSNESITLTNESYTIVPSFAISQYHNTAQSRGLNFNRYRGTLSVPTVVQAGDELSKISFQGFDGTSLSLSSQIKAEVDADATVGTGAIAGKLNFLVASNIGSPVTKVEMTTLRTLHYNQIWGQTSVPTGLPLNLVVNTDTASDGARAMMRRSRGTFEVPTSVASGDSLFRLGFGGHDGTSYRDTAFIIGEVANAVSTNVIPTKVTVKTSNSAGTLLTALEISEEQVLKVDQVDALSAESVKFNSAITLVTFADATARDAAITSPTPGMMVYISGVSKFYGYVNDAGGATPGWLPLN